MATDATGRTVVLGDEYAVVGHVVSISGDRMVIQTDGRPIAVDATKCARFDEFVTSSALTLQLSTKLSTAANLSDLTVPAVARTNLELGDSATRDVGTGSGDVAAGDHTHTLVDITDSGALAALDTADTAQIADNAVTSAKVADALLEDIAAGAVAMNGPFSFISGTQGWGTAISGSVTIYTANPEFFAPDRELAALGSVRLDGQTGVTATEAGCIYTFSRTYLATLRAFRFRICVVSEDGLLTARWGLWSNDNNPTSSGRPSGGAWIEWDSAVGDAVYLVVANGTSTTAVACSTLEIQDISTSGGGFVACWIVYESSTSVKLYADTGSGPVLEATATTNCPSTDKSRSVRLFAQIRSDGSSGTRGHVHMESPKFSADNSAQGWIAP